MDDAAGSCCKNLFSFFYVNSILPGHDVGQVARLVAVHVVGGEAVRGIQLRGSWRLAEWDHRSGWVLK